MNIILYTTKCPKCIVLEKKLNNKNIDFKVVDDIAILQTKGFMQAPMLEVDGAEMDFNQANSWINQY